MTDFQTVYNPETLTADLAIVDGDLAEENGLKTAVIMSLFTDARAGKDDILPEGETDRRGWWGEMLNDEPIGSFGSKLWLLEREKVVPEVLARAEKYARDALKWLLDEKIASSLEVVAFEGLPRIPGRGSILALSIKIHRPNAPAISYEFDRLWSNT